VVRQSLALLDAMIRKADVRCEVTAAAGTIASVDPGQLQQALTNLVVNAVQAMPDGGELRVIIERVRRAAPADVAAAGDAWVRIAIEDDGLGMTDATRARLFEPFFTTKPVGEGTGLGLPVTYGIVREHGGWIDVTSAIGHGSRFDVYLPAEAP